MVNTTNSESLPFLSSSERLSAYQLIIDGCAHIYSKNKIQQQKAMDALNVLVPLTKTDPFFLAHLTSYIMKNSKSKDLQTFLTYVSSLSSADGTPFSVGSKYMKPNLRYISSAALHQLEPKLVNRVLELANTKYDVPNHFNKARHFPTTLKTALEKYLKYRELNLEIVKGIKKAGLGNVLKSIYRGIHRAPSDEVAKILRWQQKDKKIKMDKALFSFEGKTDLQIAKQIRKEKLPVLGVLGALPRQMSPVIAVAILEQATGNQAVILRKTFEDAGVLKDKEVMALYEKKIATAKTALDRAKTISENASAEVKKALLSAKATKRKEATADIGKVFIHLDISGSMETALEIAKEKGSILAEMVNNPTENFKWGTFNYRKELLPNPTEFVEDAFKSILFGKVCDGMTDAFLLYPDAREFGADVDVFISDGGHNAGDLSQKIKDYHDANPDKKKPKVMVWVNVTEHGNFLAESNIIKESYEANGITAVKLDHKMLSESALVVEAVKTAMLGPVAVVDSIMNTPLLKLPNYYFTL